VDGAPLSDAGLREYLRRPLTPPDPDVLAAASGPPIAASDALRLTDLDRLLDPAPLPAETGWCLLPDGTGYVAVRTPMPGVDAEMIEWWFDWHPRDPLRYRIWHPAAHIDNSLDPPAEPRAKRHWGATHHPVEDLGLGPVHARIAFCAPRELGFGTDALEDPRVGTIVCGRVGDDRRRLQHSVMAHVFLRDEQGLLLRSRFWLGAAMRPYLPGAASDLIGRALNRRWLRRLAVPAEAPRALAVHCAEEFANLAALLPELRRDRG
jgi:hypothetical protein